MIEVDDWVGLRGHFTHLNEREAAKTRDPRVDVALFAALLAHGLNLPLSTMAEATDIPYHELTHVSDQYSHPYIQIISPHMREAHAALDAILHHETELPIREGDDGRHRRVYRADVCPL